MERVIVTRNMLDGGAGLAALVFMQVCAVPDATDEEILAVCNSENPAGTTHGWTRVLRSDEEWCGETIKSAPVKCEQEQDRLHFLVAC